MFGLDKIIAVSTTGLAVVCAGALWWASHDLDKTRDARDAWHASSDRWKGVAETWQRAAEDWERSFHKSENARAVEHAEAVSAANGANAFCTRQIAQAKRATLSLSNLLSREPERDEANCPRRELIPASELRDAIEAPYDTPPS
jgi:hypothetical protein